MVEIPVKQLVSANKKTKQFLVLVFLLLILGVSYLYGKYKTDSKKIAPITQEMRVVNLKNSDKYYIDTPATTENNEVVLPNDLKGLILDTATPSGVSIKRVVFPDDKKGYWVYMTETGYPFMSILGFYVKFGNNTPGWKVNQASYDTGVAIANIENSKYKVQMETAKSDSGDYPVTLKISIK